MRSANSPSEILRFAIIAANFTTTAIILLILDLFVSFVSLTFNCKSIINIRNTQMCTASMWHLYPIL